MTLANWRDAMNDGRALEFMNLLEELRKNPDVNVYTDIVDRYWTLPKRQLRADLVGDGILLGVANLLILIFMVFYFRNVLFAFAAVMQLVLALPLTFLIVDVVFKQRPVSAFACASIWVVTGVTADNIFVVHETWKAARLLRVNGELASPERRLRWTLAQSARPLFVADGTTAFSLLINCLSPIGGVFQFGLLGGVLIFTNFLLVLVYTPALLTMEEQGAFNWCNCWRMGEKEEKAHLLLLHRIHAAIFTYRRPILVAGIVLTLLLVPSAGALTAPSEGSSFDIFVGFTPPADALFINANTFNPNLPGDVYLSQTDAASSAARGEPSALTRQLSDCLPHLSDCLPHQVSPVRPLTGGISSWAERCVSRTWRSRSGRRRQAGACSCSWRMRCCCCSRRASAGAGAPLGRSGCPATSSA